MDEDARELARDERDMFAASLALGEAAQTYSLELDSLVPVFTRGPPWKEALAELRRCVRRRARPRAARALPPPPPAARAPSRRLLKKHMRHPALPMRALAGRWRLLNSRLLPLVEGYGDDRCAAASSGARARACHGALSPHRARPLPCATSRAAR